MPVEVEIYAQNNFGMAIANSLGAIQGGAQYVDCNILGNSERVGNCNFSKFVEVLNEIVGIKLFSKDFNELVKMEKELWK